MDYEEAHKLSKFLKYKHKYALIINVVMFY